MNDLSPEVSRHYIEILRDWCGTVERFVCQVVFPWFPGGCKRRCRVFRRFLEASDHSRWSAETANDIEIGPDAELLFWKRRLQKLSAITEQVQLSRSGIAWQC
jgi:hypothetical protein